MAKQEPATAPAPDSPEAIYAQQKQAFEAAKAKTARDAGAAAQKEPKAAKEPEPEKAPETPAETPEPVKAEAPPLPLPKPKKVKAEKPKAPDALATLTAQIAALEAKLSAVTAPKASEPEPADDDPFVAHRAKLAEKIGEEEADVFLEILSERDAAKDARLAQLEKIIQDATAHGRKNVAKSNRSRLAEDFPHLKVSDDAWDMLNNLVSASFEKNPKAYGSVEEAYDDIAEKLYGSLRPVEPETSDEDDDEKHASRIAASQMTPPRVAGQRQQRSRIEKQREHFEFMKKNPGDKEGARRLARELGIDR